MRSAALVGCGRMGAFTSPAVRRDAPDCWFPLAHADAIAAHPGLSLAGLTDSEPEAAARAAATHGNPPVFPDLGTMLAATTPALLCVATRTPGRADIIEQALGAGVRALHVEKPLCNSMAELASIGSRLSAADAFLTLGAVRRHMAPYRAALAEAEGGAMGLMLEVQVHFGEGALCWVHPHSIDLILFAAGQRKLVDVSAILGNVEIGDVPHDVRNDPLVLSATLRFEDGLIGRISRQPGCDMVISCRDGALAVEADGHRTMHLACHDNATYPSWKRREVDPGGAPGGTLAALSQLVACLDGDLSALAANAQLQQDVLMGQRVMFAMLQSHEAGGAPVRPADVADDWRIAGITGGRHA